MPRKQRSTPPAAPPDAPCLLLELPPSLVEHILGFLVPPLSREAHETQCVAMKRWLINLARAGICCHFLHMGVCAALGLHAATFIDIVTAGEKRVSVYFSRRPDITFAVEVLLQMEGIHLLAHAPALLKMHGQICALDKPRTLWRMSELLAFNRVLDKAASADKSKNPKSPALLRLVKKQRALARNIGTTDPGFARNLRNF